MKQFPKGSFHKSQLALFIALAASVQANAQTANVDEIEVIGSRAALMRALDRQRNSDQITGVIDSDAMGNFADINVSESLRRISGIMVENDQGEGRYVSVRGMNTDLNSMTINGVSTASPEDKRGIMLDGVPTDMLDSMTVYKTLTPSMDADTIGGSIDLETITAFSYDEMFLRVKAETSYNELTEDGNNPTLSATFANRFMLGAGELGVALNLSDQSRRIVAHNNEMGGWGDEAPNDDYEMRYYDLTRDRTGVVLNLDYITNGGTKYYAHLFRNEYTDTEYRGKWETRDGLEQTPVINGDMYTYPDTRMDSEARDREEVRSINAYQLGAEFRLSDSMQLNVEYFASDAEQDDGDQFAVAYRADTVSTPLTFDNSDPQKPHLNYAPEFYDANNFNLDVFEKEVALTTDEDEGFKADLMMGLNAETDLQFGMKYRQREKRNDFNYCGYEPMDDITLASRGVADVDSYFNNEIGPLPSSANAHSFTVGNSMVALTDGTFCAAPAAGFDFSGDEDEESVPADWLTEENITAVYAMATTTLDRMVMVYGLRYEDTSSTYQGKTYDGSGFTGTASFDKDYDFWAPSFNLKYEINDEQLARIGVFRSLVRPGFQESSAASVVDVVDNEISGGNPDLDPTTAWNLDLGYEYYLNEETFIGVGVFYKAIEDSIVEVERNDFVVQGQLWDEAGTYINADDSSIKGLEFSIQTAMENGLLFAFNYTYADGETDLPAGAVSGERTIPYFKQAQNTANFVLGYDKGAWDIRLAFNYRGEYLDEVGDDTLYDRYTSEYVSADLTARFQMTEHLQLSAAALNLNDRPEFYYFGNDRRLSQYDEYGATYTMGLRYVF